jgi:hypothetical protein
LSDVREIQISVQFCRRPDFARFYTTMFAAGNIDVLGFRVDIAKKKFNVGPEGGLVVFRDQKIMGLSLSNYIIGKIYLSMQSIGRYVLAFYIETRQQGNGDLDLVGLLLLVGIFADRQSTYFFWA